jgi:hypothetical protein
LFCARCGQQIPDASEICQLCGQETKLKLEPVPPASPSANVPYAFVTIPQVMGPSGVGGWLLLYCIGLTILAPLVTFTQIYTFWRFVNAYYLLDTVRALYGVVVGIFLWMSRPLSLFLLRIYFIILGGTILLTIMRLAAVALQTHASLFMMGSFTQIVVLTGFTILWFAYFHKSVRVRNTYGANL